MATHSDVVLEPQPSKTEEIFPSKADEQVLAEELENTGKSRWERSWPTIACGAGLFSDGYLNNATSLAVPIIGSVNTVLRTLYPETYAKSAAVKNVPSIAFAGTVVGQLVFGYLSDHYSRKWSLMASTVLLVIFAALGAGSYGAGGSQSGLFAALTAYRFFLGVGIGGEYPAGSVAAAESTGELKEGHRNRWFIMFTNFQIDFGFVVSAFVPMILVLIFTENHLRAAWRVMLGLGVIPPLSLFYLRLKLKEPEEFNRQRMHKYPVWLIAKQSAEKLTIRVVYRFSDLVHLRFLSVLLWDILFGSALGAWVSDWIGPRSCLMLGVAAQGVIGFIMAGCYKWLATAKNVAAFVVVYGLFLSFGELGPGDNIGLVASKTSATAIRGQYYGIAAALGKVGAFVGTYVFPVIQKNAPNEIRAGQDPFFVSSALCLFSAALAAFLLPHIGQDTITYEDARFRRYLEENGYDTSTLVGRDKILRTLQYFSRFLAWYLLRTNYSHATIAPFDAIKKQVALARKLLRVGKNVEHFKAAAVALDSKPSSPASASAAGAPTVAASADPVLKYLAVGRQLGYAMYLSYDIVTYLDAAGIKKVSGVKGFQSRAYRAWLAGLVCSAVAGVYSMWRLRELERRVDKKDGEGALEGKKIQRERAAVTTQLVSDMCDLTIPTSALGYINFDDGIVGIAGTISSLIGVWTMWKKTA
ncbi:glycerophosphoinositol permease [Emydomyces testavorans]|uniref:Glycerophosphoinositol permease n=1 Tax=Emydomyces testavorans TaxID=2070801 RepID=A0AAF0DII6_9EURO|nr:glycerophosphoinositol permease [Emydomyces testavorans]